MNFLWLLKNSIKLKTDQSTKKYAMNFVYIHYNDFFLFTILSLVSYNVVNMFTSVQIIEHFKITCLNNEHK